MINPVVQDRQDEIERLCARFHVKILELFGSATTGSFDTESSDLDFLMEFKRCSPSEHYDRYFGLLKSLQVMSNCPIDLVEVTAMQNPYFIRRVNESRSRICAA